MAAQVEVALVADPVMTPTPIDGGPPERFPTTEDVRRWLSAMRDPDRLVDPVMVEMLRLLGRFPTGASRAAVGQAAADLLTTAIERLKPARPSGRRERTAYQILRTCYVEGAKAQRATELLGISMRQLTRDRSRAVELVADELATLLAEANAEETESTEPPARYRFEPIPALVDFVARPKLVRALTDAVREHRFVHVHGPAGIGKTSVVAELASEWTTTRPVLWYRVRAGVNDSLVTVLFEIGEHLKSLGSPRLAEMIRASMPHADASLLSRYAVSELDGYRGVLVFDDFHRAESDSTVVSFLDDINARLPELRVVTVGRHQEPRPRSAETFVVPPLSLDETRALLQKMAVSGNEGMTRDVHDWTGGIAQLVQLAAPWLSAATPDEISGGLVAFTTQDAVQAFLLDWLTGLMDTYDRDVLEAATIFRDQFTDAALAHVSGRTLAQVSDISRRLVRFHVALRGRGGDVAFVHTSIREYVYQRLSMERRRELHSRAADWYSTLNDEAEALHHSERAAAPDA